jgi:hypothetical protein
MRFKESLLEHVIVSPVLVGLSDIFVHIAAKVFHCISGGTNIELAFVDEEDRRIDIPQFAFAHVVSAEGSVLRNISGRILVKTRLCRPRR